MMRGAVAVLAILLGCHGGGGDDPENPVGGSNEIFTEVRLDTDAPGEGASTSPRLAGSGSNVYAVWIDGRYGFDAVFFNRSTDGGRTWGASDLQLNNHPGPWGGGASDAQISCAGSSVYVVWEEGFPGGVRDIHFNRSLDAGATWFYYDMRIETDEGMNDSLAPRIACDGANVHIVWTDHRYSYPAIFYNRSGDGGETWLSSDVHINERMITVVTYGTNPEIACAGSTAYVVWEETVAAPGRDICFIAWGDFDGLQPPQIRRIDTDTTRAEKAAPRIARSGSSLYVAWQDCRKGAGTDIRFNRSLDGGATWLDEDICIDPDVTDPPFASFSTDQRIAASGADVGVTWVEDNTIRFSRSTDGGTTWPPVGTRLDSGQTTWIAVAPRIARNGNLLAVAWHDDRLGIRDAYISRSLDAGVSWEGDSRLRAEPPGSVAMEPVVCPVETGVQAAWMDFRNGKSDIYSARR